MKVILVEDVKALGKKGEMVNVSDGYARNMLFPKKLALEASAKNINDLKLKKAHDEKVAKEQLADARAFAEELAKAQVKVSVKVGEGGKVFGSVSSKEIAVAVKDQMQLDIDKKKIQLLTLGAGFDMELSAKENVYLNGAIIGYTKEFIDLHYDEIVSFAELDGFMDEKVKNFSSGMVSRLGFAIATVGDAAEILILDEVLSVGDEFFRKKSLSRVQELIHGGSTVLMVSHGIGTILKNCTN